MNQIMKFVSIDYPKFSHILTIQLINEKVLLGKLGVYTR